MTIPLNLNSKVYLAVTLSTSIFIVIMVTLFFKTQHISDSLQELHLANSSLKDYIALSGKIEKLKKYSLRYYLTGDSYVIRLSNELYGEIIQTLSTPPLTNLEELSQTLDSLRKHTYNFQAHFQTMHEQRPIHNNFKNELHEESAKIKSIIEESLKENNSLEVEPLFSNILIELLQVENSVQDYFEELDKKCSDRAYQSIDMLFHYLQEIEKRESTTSSYRARELKLKLHSLRVVTTKLLQHFKAYLMLDVVITGETYEMLHYSYQLQNSVSKISKEIKDELSELTQLSSSTVVIGSSLFILFMVINSFILLRVITLPLRNLTETFEALVAGNDVQIQNYKFNDDIGKLTKAAQAFEKNNLRIKLLLEKSNKLTESLQISKHRLRIASESGYIGVWEYNIQTSHLYWDQTMFKIYGVTEDTFSYLFREWIEMIIRDDAERVRQELDNAITKNTRLDTKFKIERKRDGRVRTIKAYGDILYEDGHPIKVVGVNYDITDSETLRESLEIQVTAEVEKKREQHKLLLQHQSKLAAMGEMIGAIAHQWRQPLSELNIKIQKLKYNYANGDIDEEFIGNFIKGSRSVINFMNQTIDDFRNFFRDDKQKHNFKIRGAIDEILSIQNSQLKAHNIQLYTSGNDFQIYGFKSEFQQVVLNIINNAKDVLIANKVNQPFIRIQLSNLSIEIEDNGGGVPPEIIDRIFDPYFTTKSSQDGTGMGLYISKMIVEESINGRIEVKNSDGGAVFSIYFQR